MSDGMISVVIFVLVMVLIISEKVHRAVAAVLGAIALMLVGIHDVASAAHHIDYTLSVYWLV